MKVLQTSALPLGYGAIRYFYTLWIPEICPFGPVFGSLGAGLSLKRGSKLSAGLPKPSIHSETGMRYRLQSGAGNGARTRHLSLGKAALYQMSYSRNGASEWSRTTDTGIFSPLLYQLSYRGKDGDPKGARTPDLQRDRLAF